MPRRKWKKWPSRFNKGLASTAGLGSLVGLAITAAGATVAAPIAITVGGVTILSSLTYAAIRGIPPKLPIAEDFCGKPITLSQLKEIDPPILTLGIVGSSQSGKSTFIEHIRQRMPSTERTNKIYAIIIPLQTTPTTFVALLDGDGEQFPQQFDITSHSDFLLVFLDHNTGGDCVARSKNRITEHERFLQQLEFHIKANTPVPRIHMVLNKRDLWENSRNAGDLRDWFNDKALVLKRASIAEEFSYNYHSNKLTEDISQILRLIRDSATS